MSIANYNLFNSSYKFTKFYNFRMNTKRTRNTRQKKASSSNTKELMKREFEAELTRLHTLDEYKRVNSLRFFTRNKLETLCLQRENPLKLPHRPLEGEYQFKSLVKKFEGKEESSLSGFTENEASVTVSEEDALYNEIQVHAVQHKPKFVCPINIGNDLVRSHIPGFEKGQEEQKVEELFKEYIKSYKHYLGVKVADETMINHPIYQDLSDLQMPGFSLLKKVIHILRRKPEYLPILYSSRGIKKPVEVSFAAMRLLEYEKLFWTNDKNIKTFSDKCASSVRKCFKELMCPRCLIF